MIMATEENRKERRGIPLFKVAGIQITLDLSWFIVFFLILWSLSAGYFPRKFPDQTTQTYWTAGFFASILFFLSVIIHELSHSLMAIRSGIKIPEIMLFIFGGIAKLSEEAKDPVKELKIAIVGPLSSLGLAVIFWVMQLISQALGSALFVVIFGYLAWINVALAIFNLIPGFPLDGGRVLRALIWWRTGSLQRATKWASDVGKGFAIVLMVFGALQIFQGMLIGGFWLLFIGIFLRGVAEGGYQEVVVRQALEGVPVSEVMIRDVVKVPPEISIDRLVNDYFLRYGYKGFPVGRDGLTLGVVALTEVKKVPEDEQRNTTVQAIMTPMVNCLQIDPGVSLAEALKKMTECDVARLLVMQEGEMIGMITKTGLFRFIEIKRILDR
jgi:Zn-dependent protease/CBS domain-containing protein